MSEEDQSEHTVGNDDEPSMNVNKIDYEQELKQLQALTRNEDKSESRVGKKLSESTQKAVIVLVLTMLLSTAFLQPSTYVTEPEGYEFGLKLAASLRLKPVAFDSVIESYVSSYEDTRTPALYINVPDIGDSDGQIIGNYTYPTAIPLDSLRDVEKEIVVHEDKDKKLNVAVFDLRKNNKLQALLSICTTIFVVFVLGAGTLILSRVTQEMVITPIEEMMTKVKRISENPLKAQQDEENEQLIIEKYELGGSKKKSKEAPLETVMLEQTLIKIGGLLALGFGEAGSSIIAKNMSGGEDINPMLAGQKVICIFGFCDIRNFTDATEELQEGVMLFVNEIGEIVHGIVDRYSGAANKNIGDAFLLVWKFDEDSMELDQETDEISLIPSNKVSQLCDMSMISFLKIMAALKRSRKMKVYAKHEGLNRRMPGYSVRLGFGLHLGWAIEGAIGSYYKIDASYLSPHVNMAGRLEEMTKAFGAPMLISGSVYDFFTEGCKAMCRQIDHVIIKGMDETLRLFTCDAYIEDLVLEEDKPPLSKQQKKQARVKARIARDSYKDKIGMGEI